MPLTILLAVLAQVAADGLEHRTRSHELSNGMRVVVVEDHTLPLVSIQLWYAAGWRDEPPEAGGVCHDVLEWLAGNLVDPGTDQRLDRNIETEIASDTSRVATVVPSQHLEPALTAIAARLDLENALKTLRVHRDPATPRFTDFSLARFDPLLWHLVRPAPPAAATAPASAKGAASSSHDAALEFARSHFAPANSTLFIIGDVVTPRALDLATALFAGQPSPPRPPNAFRDPPPEEHIRLVPPTGPYMPVLELGWLIPPGAWAEFAATEVLFERLFDPATGELAAELRAAGLASRWHFDPCRDLAAARLTIQPLVSPSGPPVASVEWEPGRVESLERLVRAGLERMAAEPANLPAHTRAVRTAERAARSRVARFHDYALHLARREMIDGNLLLADFDLARYGHMPVAAVRRAAIELLSSRSVSRLPGRDEAFGRFGAVRAGRGSSAPWDRPTLTVTSPASAPGVIQWTVGGARVILCPLPGAPLVVLRVDANPGEENVAQRAAARGRVQTAIDEWHAVASYRGLEFAYDEGAVVASGPPELTPQLIERSLGLLRAGWPPAAEPGASTAGRVARTGPQIIVVGDVQAQSLEPLLATLLGDEPGFAPSGVDKDGAASDRSRLGPRLRVRVEIDPMAGTRLALNLQLPPAARPAETARVLEAGLLCADRAYARQRARDPAAPGDLVAWPTSRLARRPSATPWRYRIEPDGVTLAADVWFSANWPREPRIEPLDKLQALQSWADRDALEAALQRSRLNRLCEMDGARAVADALARGIDNPWDLADELDADECLRLLRQLFPAGALLIEAPGVDAALRDELRRYGEVR